MADCQDARVLPPPGHLGQYPPLRRDYSAQGWSQPFTHLPWDFTWNEDKRLQEWSDIDCQFHLFEYPKCRRAPTHGGCETFNLDRGFDTCATIRASCQAVVLRGNWVPGGWCHALASGPSCTASNLYTPPPPCFNWCTIQDDPQTESCAHSYEYPA